MSFASADRKRRKHRNIKFEVHRVDDNHWEWVVYPKMGDRLSLAGVVEGGEEKASAAARFQIDLWFGVISAPCT
jgi:hypothetical protein